MFWKKGKYPNIIAYDFNIGIPVKFPDDQREENAIGSSTADQRSRRGEIILANAKHLNNKRIPYCI
jgi:hypothetical protein